MSMSDLFDQLEQEARARSVGLEALGKLPTGYTDRHYPLTPRELSELHRLKAAAHAAVDVDTFVALCKGLPVPAARLNSDLVNFKRRIDNAR